MTRGAQLRMIDVRCAARPEERQVRFYQRSRAKRASGSDDVATIVFLILM